MNQEPNFGPYASIEPVKSFQLLSKKAFQSYHRLINQYRGLISRPVHHLFLRMAYQAETTSLSIHLSNSWALNLPALALTRIRLEQTIICSYLIHEDEAVGLAPFVTYISIGEYKGTKAALEDPTIAQNLTSIDMGKLEAEAVKAQQEFNSSFTIENDKFERNWTKLDLRSMSKKRDNLIKNHKVLRIHRLEREYITYYKTASSVVHADCSSLSQAFLDIFPAPNGSPVLMAVPSWSFLVAAATAHYDILQCYEILSYFKMPFEDEHNELMGEWMQYRDKYVK